MKSGADGGISQEVMRNERMECLLDDIACTKRTREEREGSMHYYQGREDEEGMDGNRRNRFQIICMRGWMEKGGQLPSEEQKRREKKKRPHGHEAIAVKVM